MDQRFSSMDENQRSHGSRKYQGLTIMQTNTLWNNFKKLFQSLFGVIITFFWRKIGEYSFEIFPMQVDEREISNLVN